MITLNDISSKVFSDQELGYSKDEVDDFLDEIATDYAALIKENRSLKKKLEEQEEQAKDDSALSEPGYLKNLEATLRETLLTAQRIADETTDQAKKSAEETVAAAEEQARTIVATAKVEADQTRADLAELKKAAYDYRARFQRLVLDQVHVLKSDTELFADK